MSDSEDKLVEILKSLSKQGYQYYEPKNYDYYFDDNLFDRNGLNCSDKHIFDRIMDCGLDDLKKLKEELIKEGYSHQEIRMLLSVAMQLNHINCNMEDNYVNVHINKEK